MQGGSRYRVRTVAATHFLAGQAQNVAAVETLDLLAAVATTTGDRSSVAAGGHMRSILRELRIISVQNLAWEVWLFATSTIGGATIGSEKFLGRWTFVAADGIQATGDSFFYYYINGLDQSVQDLATSGKLYVRLVNRDAVAKNAGATGALEIEFALEPVQGI